MRGEKANQTSGAPETRLQRVNPNTFRHRALWPKNKRKIENFVDSPSGVRSEKLYRTGSWAVAWRGQQRRGELNRGSTFPSSTETCLPRASTDVSPRLSTFTESHRGHSLFFSQRVFHYYPSSKVASLLNGNQLTLITGVNC